MTQNTKGAGASLKACPMCSGTAFVMKGFCLGGQWEHGAFHRVFCGACQLRQLFHKTEAAAIAAWNRRAPTAVQAAQEAGWADQVPCGWIRGVESYVPGEPTEWNVDFSWGDDEPEDGHKWKPIYLSSAAPQGWKPIETAPKDGSMFLGWVDAIQYGESDEGAQFEMNVSEHDFCRWNERDDYFENMMGKIGDAYHVTHWMPLPAAPAASSGDQEVGA